MCRLFWDVSVKDINFSKHPSIFCFVSKSKVSYEKDMSNSYKSRLTLTIYVVPLDSQRNNRKYFEGKRLSHQLKRNVFRQKIFYIPK